MHLDAWPACLEICACRSNLSSALLVMAWQSRSALLYILPESATLLHCLFGIMYPYWLNTCRFPLLSRQSRSDLALWATSQMMPITVAKSVTTPPSRWIQTKHSAMRAPRPLSALVMMCSFLLSNTGIPAPTPPPFCHVQTQVLVEATAPICWPANK